MSILFSSLIGHTHAVENDSYDRRGLALSDSEGGEENQPQLVTKEVASLLGTLKPFTSLWEDIFETLYFKDPSSIVLTSKFLRRKISKVLISQLQQLHLSSLELLTEQVQRKSQPDEMLFLDLVRHLKKAPEEQLLTELQGCFYYKSECCFSAYHSYRLTDSYSSLQLVI
jgi:hypothetical protein